MKKMSILFFASMLLFFSCATSGEAAKSDSHFEASPQNAESEISSEQIHENEISDGQISGNEIDESETSEAQIPEEADEVEIMESEVPTEKISQEELDELERLLAQGEIPVSEIVIPDDDFGAEEELEDDAEIAEEEIAEAGEEEFPEEPLIAEENEIPENELPAQNEDDLRSEDMPLTPAADEISARDFPVQDEGTARENFRNEPPFGNVLSGNYDFSDEETADSENEIPEDEIPEMAEKEIVIPSRTMSVKRNQYVDIVYPGSGWIYLGETDGAEHFSFHGRTLSDDECTFTLRSKKAGNAILHFYKNDALTGNYIDDYIAIEIGEEVATDSSHVLAPSYAQAVPKRFESTAETASNDGGSGDLQDSDGGEKGVSDDSSGSKSSEGDPSSAEGENRPAERVQTVIQDSQKNSQGNANITSVAGVENSVGAMKDGSDLSSQAQKDEYAAQGLLEQAQKAYDEKRYADALSLVRRFFEAATSDFDAGLYLQGLVLEADSQVRDIKSAIESYDAVVKNFPQSKFWTRANERGIYLKRFYIDIK